jgi:hypothetical protein
MDGYNGLQDLAPKHSNKYTETARRTREGRVVDMMKRLNGAVLKIQNCGGDGDV